jgi:hypothetical protein
VLEELGCSSKSIFLTKGFKEWIALSAVIGLEFSEVGSGRAFLDNGSHQKRTFFPDQEQKQCD